MVSRGEVLGSNSVVDKKSSSAGRPRWRRAVGRAVGCHPRKPVEPFSRPRRRRRHAGPARMRLGSRAAQARAWLAPPEWPITASCRCRAHQRLRTRRPPPTQVAPRAVSTLRSPGGRRHPTGAVPEGSGGQRLRRLAGVGRAVVPEHGERHHHATGAGVVDVQRSPSLNWRSDSLTNAGAYFGGQLRLRHGAFRSIEHGRLSLDGGEADVLPWAQEGPVAAPEVRSRAQHRRYGRMCLKNKGFSGGA